MEDLIHNWKKYIFEDMQWDMFYEYLSDVEERISFRIKMSRRFSKQTEKILKTLSTCIQSLFFYKLFLRRETYSFKLARN